MSRRDRTVYSSEHGRVCASCGLPASRCACRARPRSAPRDAARSEGDGVARVGREKKGRGGKTVTTIRGLALSPQALRELARELKRHCGTGGAVKDGVIEIQGDHRDALLEELGRRGLRSKHGGG